MFYYFSLCYIMQEKLLLALLRILTKITSRFGTTRYKILVESGGA